METLCLIRVLLIKLLRPNIIRMGGQSTINNEQISLSILL
jgi:hypothetical protein